MRITIVNRHVQQTLGGSEIQCDLIAQGLAKLGHEVTYIAPSLDRNDISVDLYKLKTVEPTASGVLNGILESKPDVVYWRFNRNNFYYIAKSIRRESIPFIFAASDANDVALWPVDTRVGWNGWRGWAGRQRRTLRSIWERHGFRYVTAMTLLNSDLYGQVRGVPQTYIPNAMIQSTVDFEWPRSFCAWIANLKPRKRPEKFVELAESLKDTGIDFLMVGGLQSKRYEWISNRDLVPSNFYYIGSRTLEEVNGILSQSLFHVHTCGPEGFGNVFIQAWLQGRPSVSLGHDPAGYLEQQGIGFDAKEDWTAFIEAARRYVTNKTVREEAGERARLFAEATFSIDKMVEQVEEVLLKAVRDRPGGHD